jgi:ribosome maturation factor RimP
MGKNKMGRPGGRPVSKASLKIFLGQVTSLAEPALAGMGLELVRAQAQLTDGRPILRLFIDRLAPTSVSLDDCAAVSRALETALEAFEDEAPDGYVLEISSPGLDRPLLKPEDCFRFQGRSARLKLRRGGALSVYRGRLSCGETGGLALDTESGRIDFDWSEVVSGRLDVDEKAFLANDAADSVKRTLP